MLGLKLADFGNPNPNLEDLVRLPKFIQFLYYSHPSAIDVTGSGMASLIFSELEKCGTTISSMKNLVGLCGDGQYLNNNVLQHIEDQNCLEGLFNLWDIAHMWELIWSNGVSKCPEVVNIIDGVNAIIRDLANSWYESYHAACEAKKVKMPQPSALKRLKFVKHVEQQFTKFMNNFTVILVVVEQEMVKLKKKNSEIPETVLIVGKVQSASEEEKKKEEKAKAAAEVKLILKKTKEKLTKTTKMIQHKDFLPKLALINNTIQFVSKFSLAGQSKHLNIAEYVNLVDLGKEALSKLKFQTFPSPIMQYHHHSK